jgi:glutathione S-transferase
MKIWGRKDGSNVIKVMWCIGELGIPHERIDWGGPFGGNDDPAYLAKNPNGRLPTLEEDDGFTLWESGAVLRYLCAVHGRGGLWPEDPRERATADRWMDWSSLYLAPFNAALLDYHFRLSPPQRDRSVMEAAVAAADRRYAVLDAHLANRSFLNGEHLSMADFPAGTLTHRWMSWVPDRPSHPNVEAWYRRLCERPAYQEHVVAATKSLPAS